MLANIENQNTAVGTRLIDPYDNEGFIYSVGPSNVESFVIGGNGMEPVRERFKVVWSNRIDDLPDGIAAPMIARATHLPPITDPNERERLFKTVLDAAKAARELSAVAAVAAREKRAACEAELKRRTPPWAKALIIAELVADKSDLMSDYHGSITTRRVALAWSKHTRDLFPEMRKAAALFEHTADLATAPESAEHREKYSMGGGFYLKKEWRNQDGWKVSKVDLRYGSTDIDEWMTDQPALAASAPVERASVSAGMHIETHTHTKKGFQMHICILAERVEREEYLHLLSEAKALGGWYTKPWGNTPGGFAFKDPAAAQAFAARMPAADNAPAAPRAAPRAAPVAKNPAEKLRALADGLQSDIDNKFSDRRTNTPKQMREAGSARQSGRKFERAQKALRRLAGMHDSGTVPATLAGVTTKTKILELCACKIDRSNAGYYDNGIELNEPADPTPEALALWSLFTVDPAAQKAEELQTKISALKFAKIPGYFPTPAPVVALMLEAADIAPGHTVLEPSAGSGSIADACPKEGLTVVERMASLCEVLRLKGYDAHSSDFMDFDDLAAFDRVLMNPPFEKGQDMEHIRHAFKMLRSGGRLVAVMAPGFQYKTDRKSADFRAWFDAQSGEVIHELDSGTFKDSGTGVTSLMIQIDKA